MFKALSALGKSRKALVSAAAIITAAVLLFLGRISAEQFVGLIAIMAPTLVGATALEDAAAKYSATPPTLAAPAPKVEAYPTPTPDLTGPEKEPLRLGERYPVSAEEEGRRILLHIMRLPSAGRHCYPEGNGQPPCQASS